MKHGFDVFLMDFCDSKTCPGAPTYLSHVCAVLVLRELITHSPCAVQNLLVWRSIAAAASPLNLHKMMPVSAGCSLTYCQNKTSKGASTYLHTTNHQHTECMCQCADELDQNQRQQSCAGNLRGDLLLRDAKVGESYIHPCHVHITVDDHRRLALQVLQCLTNADGPADCI